AVLPCHLSPRMSAANMEVRWFHSEFAFFVHLYRDGKDQYDGQMPGYRGRTELLKAGLTDGIVPLRILNIRCADEGQYLCFVQDDTVYEETVLELWVAGLGSAPLISVEGHQDGGIQVVCQSAGWYPEPEVLWKDLSGRHLPTLSETTSQRDNGLFETETALIVIEHSNQNLSCFIRNTVLNQEKESAVYIADQLPSKSHTEFTVIGPSDPVTAILGQEAVLPCHLSPRMSAANMEVRWFHSEFASFVHLYRDGKDQYDGQMPDYWGRTELLKAGLTDGIVPLRILGIRRADEGRYLCFVQDDTFYGETVLELWVAGLGSAPLISVEGHQDGGIRVFCQSAGWYPEPEVLWKDLNGRHLPSLSETTSERENGLFETETALIVIEHSNQNLSCCIRNTLLNQEKESAVYIAGQLPSKSHTELSTTRNETKHKKKRIETSVLDIS
uniref:Ig-like domain-containing protein n=1 Tax=Chelonoidis abingdonii TaxID=106734 RepID=A0A8C0GCK9_CHEAB